MSSGGDEPLRGKRHHQAFRDLRSPLPGRHGIFSKPQLHGAAGRSFPAAPSPRLLFALHLNFSLARRLLVRDSEIIKWTGIARDFRSNSRRPVRRILDVFVGRDNEEFGRKDWQDGSFYFFRVPKDRPPPQKTIKRHIFHSSNRVAVNPNL